MVVNGNEGQQTFAFTASLKTKIEAKEPEPTSPTFVETDQVEIREKKESSAAEQERATEEEEI